MDGGLLSIISAGSGQLVKVVITLSLHGIFGSYFACLYIYIYIYIYIYKHCPVTGMQNGDEALPSIIFVCPSICQSITS